jgi:predicted phosphodiesterase
LRYLILSDIHANVTALNAVLAAAGGVDAIINCGDVVGYGPDPNEAVQFCRERCAVVVRGNHDKAAVGQTDLDWFNSVARTSVEWTTTQLSPEHAEWLAALPRGPVEFDGFTVVHGAPYDEDEYIVGPMDVRYAADYLTTGVTFFGHTHLQGAFELHRNGVRMLDGPEVVAEETSWFLINPGSVGQPRDGDPRAGFALYDTSSRLVEFHRVDYDLDQTYHRILEAGLPEVLGLRLFRGV